MIQYSDDFLLLGSPHSDGCAQALAITLSTCCELGIPLEFDKTEGRNMKFAFLGVLLNSASLSES